MHNCIILLGSNSDVEKNLPEARKCLEQILCFEHYTTVIESPPYGGKGPSPYHNQMVEATTALTFSQLKDTLKNIEKQLGRTQEDREQGIVNIDLDILQYDDTRHHLRDWERPYVQQLLPQLEGITHTDVVVG